MNLRPSKIRMFWGIVALSTVFLLLCTWNNDTMAASQKGATSSNIVAAKPIPLSAPATTVASKGKTGRMKLVSLSFDEPFYYNPKGRIDPFKPFLLKILARTKKGKKVLPLTPLQKLSYVELQRGLVAIVWGHLGNRALIQDAAGKGYIVKPGTPVGPNGVVKQILSDRVIIEQTITDVATNKKIRKEITLTLNRGEKGEI